MLHKDIIREIERFAAPELQEGWDNSGLIIGDAGAECTGVLTALDATEAVMDEAIERGCNLLLVHHPPIFSGLRRLNGRGFAERIAMKALQHGIAIYACHTPLDNVIKGVSGAALEGLGVERPRVLVPKPAVLRRLITFAPFDKAAAVRQALFDAGAGHIGLYSDCSYNSTGAGTFKAEPGADPYLGEIGVRHTEQEVKIETVYPFYLEPQVVAGLKAAHPYEEVAYDIFTMQNVHDGIGLGAIGDLKDPMPEADFLRLLADTFGPRSLRHSPLTGRTVKTVAFCGGSGADFLRHAQAAGADWYVTSDVKYHTFFDAGDRLVLADIGHAESERHSAALLQRLVAEKYPTFAVLKSGLDTDPVHHFLP